MKEVSIGEMRHRLALEAPLETADGGGGVTRTWSLVAEVWGAIRPISGHESAGADGLSGRVSHVIWIRHRTGVTPDMRIRMGTRIFDIKAAIDVSERRRLLRCLVEERVR